MRTSRDLRYDAEDPLSRQRYMHAQQSYHLPHQPGYHDRRQTFQHQFQKQFPYYDVTADDVPPPVRSAFLDGSAFQAPPAPNRALQVHRQAMGLDPIAGSLLTQKPVAGSVSDLMMTNRIDFPTSNDRTALLTAPSDERATKERRTRVNIDSSNRNPARWPTPSHYAVHMGRSFTNIKRVTLISSEIPNTEQLVKANPPSRQNNLIFWQNQADGNAVYVASVTAGNYDATSLQAALQASMNNVKRNGTNVYHNFQITIDSVTEICTFTQAVSAYVATPLASTAGSSIVTVTFPNHGFVNQTIVTISGAVTLGGINQAAINNTVIITVLDPNTFTYDCGQPATQTASGGGGASVQVSTGLVFRMLFAQGGTMASLLGFPSADTSFALSQSNTTIVATVPIATVSPLNVGLTFETVIVTSTPHNVTSGTKVYIQGVTGSDADQVINDDGGYVVTVVTPTSFTIPVFARVAATPRVGNMVVRTLSNPVNLSPQNYIFLTSPALPSMSNSGGVENVFAKIQLSGAIGSTMFNSHIASPMNFDDAFLPLLQDLEVQFKNAGNLEYDFNNVDHSFTLEIVEVLDVPAVTGFDTRRGAVTES